MASSEGIEEADVSREERTERRLVKDAQMVGLPERVTGELPVHLSPEAPCLGELVTVAGVRCEIRVEPAEETIDAASRAGRRRHPDEPVPPLARQRGQTVRLPNE